jgi:hypothetical protein
MSQPGPAMLSRLRSICLALPDAVEKPAWDTPTFRVHDKIFAIARIDQVYSHEQSWSLWCKAPPGIQAILVAADPRRFFRPPYVGPKGWIGLRLDAAVDWLELEALVSRSYRMTAPKRLLSTPADIRAAPSRQKSPRAHRPRRQRPAASTH